MSGSGGVSTSRFHHGEDRFYCTPARRQQQQLQKKQLLLQQQQKQLLLQQQQQQQQLQQQQQQQQLEREREREREREMNFEAAESEVENRTGSADSTSSKPSVCSTNRSNLDSFLESTTPYVPVQRLSKTKSKEWRNGDVELHPYFVLEDLWESFKEWSAYGAGVPLVLNDTDSVVQYYVPYLSAIQLYVNPSKPPSAQLQRRPGDESDVESRESSSNASHTSDTDSSKNLPNSSSSEDGDVYSSGLLKFQYFEEDSPYSREPLTDKILDLASRFPELKTYKSCDLLPTSWISVAWYPIYRIPMGPTLRDLDASFLTFHTLSTPLNSIANGVMEASPKLSLPIFGLASYKFKGSVWAPNEHYELQRTNSLLQAADNWLRSLQVHHPDYGFFVSRTAFPR